MSTCGANRSRPACSTMLVVTTDGAWNDLESFGRRSPCSPFRSGQISSELDPVNDAHEFANDLSRRGCSQRDDDHGDGSEPATGTPVSAQHAGHDVS